MFSVQNFFRAKNTFSVHINLHRKLCEQWGLKKMNELYDRSNVNLHIESSGRYRNHKQNWGSLLHAKMRQKQKIIPCNTQKISAAANKKNVLIITKMQMKNIFSENKQNQAEYCISSTRRNAKKQKLLHQKKLFQW